MLRRLGAASASLLIILITAITLLGLLVGDNLGLATGMANALLIRQIAALLVRVVMVVLAVTVLVGVFNLLTVHATRIRKPGGLYSIVLILSFMAVIITYMFRRDTSMILLEDVQVSIESALAGLVFFALVFGAYRVLRRRVTWAGVLFVTVMLIVLVGALPLPGTGFVATIRDWLMNIPVSAGARGILLGIALATLVTGVRVLTGQDRSYRE